MPDKIRTPGIAKQPTVQDLLQQYKSVRDIPDAALESVGFARVDDGNRIVPKSRLPDIEREKREKQEMQERKRLNQPFETLPLEVSANQMGRHVDFSEVELLFENLQRLENDVPLDAGVCIKEIDGDGSPLAALLQELKGPA